MNVSHAVSSMPERAATRGVVFDVQTYTIYDGPGIRTCVFFKGCPLRCPWCHNPESWEPGPQEMQGPDRTERVGHEIGAGELAEQIVRDKPFFDRSGGGVTLTGGEPTASPDFLTALLDELGDRGIHRALETSGYYPVDLNEELLPRVELFLFDVKHADPERHRRATGVGNRRILANLDRLLNRAGVGRLVPRVPLVPGFNTTPRSLEAIAALLTDRGYSGEVHLMPFHGWARGKFERLGLESAYRSPEPLDDEARGRAVDVFEAAGLVPVLGG